MLPETRSVWRAARAQARRYHKEEDGSLIIFSLFLFIVMIMFGGIAVDLMLYENRRTHIQNATDRAVLAAANLNQSVSAKTVVQDYLAKAGITISQDQVVVTEIMAGDVVTGRQVSVSITGGFDTLLMDMVGVDSLPYGSGSEAVESFKDVEVSLILDVSGSMGWGTKLGDMQSAAKDFLDQVLEGAEDDRVSVSLVPYSTQVSAGEALLDELVTKHNHDYSHCLNFEEADFETTAIQRFNQAVDSDGILVFETDAEGNVVLGDEGQPIPVMDTNNPIGLSQTAHFDPWRNWRYGISLRNVVCRYDADFHINPWSNDLTDLKQQIDGFTASGNTSIDVAIKWGAALLDPSMRDVLNELKDDPSYGIDNAFGPRPHEYDGEGESVLKFIVVMTDGINTTQYALKDPFKEGMSPYHMEGDGDILVRGEVDLDENGIDYVEPGNKDGNGGSYEQWYNLRHRSWKNSPVLPNVQLSWLDAWANMNMSRRAYGAYHQTSDSDDYYDALYNPRDNVNAAEKDSRMAAICTAAKEQNIIIYSIGFEVTDHSANVMRDCASTPDHFYRVIGGDEIEYAFDSIAGQINQLRLSQ
ncbi:MAG: pilus assembly protein TadG-related protein [Silicimonas sp.]|nr:pilus assembly protein TadG-related protein [Silicimonas sp.]